MNRDRKKEEIDRTRTTREVGEGIFYDKINVGQSSLNYWEVKKNPSTNYEIETPLNYLKQEV